MTRTVLIIYGVVFCCNSLASAAEDDSRIKNVLFIVSDDLKASVLACYGDQVGHTPNIDRLARQGMVFESAYCQGTWCAPSRRSFMFSRYRGTSPVNMGQHFKDNGWFSARVGKIYHMAVPGDIIRGTNGKDVASSWTERFNSQGLEAGTPGEYACLNLNLFTSKLEGRESTGMPNRMFVSVRCEGDGSDQPDHKTATKIIELLREHHEEPFFLAAGFIRPHYPMVQPQPYFDLYPWSEIELPQKVDNDLGDIPRRGRAKSTSASNGIGKYPDNQKRMWSAYYASVSFMDKQVGRILNELDRLRLRDNTAIVFTSDHGYHLGEHDFWLKSNFHEEVIHVPLIVAVPGRNAGRSRSIVELLDIYPTLSELVGLQTPGGVQGKSLVPILDDPAAKIRSEALTVMANGGVSLRSPHWHYMHYADGSEELYDMESDPHEFTNLAMNAQYASILHELRLRMDERMRLVRDNPRNKDAF